MASVGLAKIQIASATVVGAALLLSACSLVQNADGGSSGETVSAEVEAVAKAEKAEKEPPEISVKNGSKKHNPYEPVKVTSAGKGLKSVTMSNEAGYVVAEKLSADGNTWTSAETLGYNRTYTVVAEDNNGQKNTVKFSTPTMNAQTTAALSPLEGSEVGVGQTIATRFEVPVADRKAAQDAIEIVTTPHVDAAFYWVNNYEVRWRPQYYWEPGTKVEVKVKLKGVDLGNGVFGSADNSTTFTIGDRVVAIVDDYTKSMEVWRNKKLLRTIPVSLGTDGGRWATPNGRYIIGDQHEQLLMDSSTFGYSVEEGGYKTMVNYATQMSYSGIYVHGAPWSEWAQGNTNTSHGCVNVTDSAAKWFMENTKRGDIVRVKNTTGPTLSPLDGLGDWNMSWEKWSAGNADEGPAS